MAIYLKEFSTQNEYEQYINGSGAILPNVSICKDTPNEVHYNPYVDPSGGHEYVEIGGIKWATMNIGATCVTDYGLYFQWGDISGYTVDQVTGSTQPKKVFSWVNYKYGNGTFSPGATGMTKYNSTDGLTTLESSDDAATANWVGSWRIPTKAEFEALSDAVNSAWTADYQGSGVSGLVLTDKTDSSKVLFFPAAGYCDYSNVNSVGNNGYYWSSSVMDSGVQNAHYLVFASSYVSWSSFTQRSKGYAVRGVMNV